MWTAKWKTRSTKVCFAWLEIPINWIRKGNKSDLQKSWPYWLTTLWVGDGTWKDYKSQIRWKQRYSTKNNLNKRKDKTS